MEKLSGKADRTDHPSVTSQNAFTLKAFLAGSLLSLCIGLGPLYGNMVLRASYLALDFSTAGAVALFFVLVGFFNVLLKIISRSLRSAFWACIFMACLILLVTRTGGISLLGGTILGVLSAVAIANLVAVSLGRSLVLNRGELLVTYIMMIVASAVPTMGLTEYLLTILPGGYYYASVENNWSDLIHPYIPGWIAPQDPLGIKYFYEGAPSGYGIPWKIWLKPIGYWAILIAAAYWVMICGAVVLRRQWVERERLIYPLVQMPMAIDEEDRGLINPFFKNLLMWVGFAIPVIVGTVNALHYYYRSIPGIKLETSVYIFRHTVEIPIRVSFPIIGFSYFINTDIALGIWIFNALVYVQRGIFNVIGYGSTEKLGIYSFPSCPIIAHQSMGAFLALVFSILWIGRSHLKDVFRKAFGKAQDVDDSGEIMSYRTAVFGAILGLAIMQVWLWISGLPFWATAIFIFVIYALYIGVTKIVVQGGVAVTRGPMIPSDFLISGFGVSTLGPRGLVSLAFSYTWAADIRTFVMASVTHGLKIIQTLPGKRRRLLWGIIVAIAVSFVSSSWLILKFAYAEGGINLNNWFFEGGVRAPFDFIGSKLNFPTGANWIGWIWTGIGGGLMFGLMWLQRRFLWWPVHPIGFAIGTMYTTDQIAFSVFLAWLLKVVILKYGGPKFYRTTKPFFFGLIAGQFVIAAVWLVIDHITGTYGNCIYWI